MKMLFRSIFAIKVKNKNSINLKIDYKNKIMKNKLLKSTGFLKLVLRYLSKNLSPEEYPTVDIYNFSWKVKTNKSGKKRNKSYGG